MLSVSFLWVCSGETTKMRWLFLSIFFQCDNLYQNHLFLKIKVFFGHLFTHTSVPPDVNIISEIKEHMI